MFWERTRIRAHHLGGLVDGQGGSCLYHRDLANQLASKPGRRISIIEGPDYFCERCPFNPKSSNFSSRRECDPNDTSRINRDRWFWSQLEQKAQAFGIKLNTNTTIRVIQRLIEVNY